MTDYAMKLLNQRSMSAEDLMDLEFAPHQNEHIKMIGRLAEDICVHLADRPVALIQLNAPLLIIGDEPVVLGRPDGSRRIPERAMSGYPSVVGDVEPAIMVQFTTGETTGLEDADDVAFPLAPDQLLYYGSPREALPPRTSIEGSRAGRLAREVNREIVARAVDWVAARPSHPSFRKMSLVKPLRILGVIDGGSLMAQAVNSSELRQPRRFRSPTAADLE